MNRDKQAGVQCYGHLYVVVIVVVVELIVKLKQLLYRPRQAERVPGG